jgi:hypothetical protein
MARISRILRVSLRCVSISIWMLKHQRTGRSARTDASAHHAVGTWDETERVICRVQVSDKGTDVRYIATSFQVAGAKYLYETAYCSRDKMGLTIKDHKTVLKSDRTSCHRKDANQFRLLIRSAAYVPMHALRENLPRSSELARALNIREAQPRPALTTGPAPSLCHPIRVISVCNVTAWPRLTPPVNRRAL